MKLALEGQTMGGGQRETFCLHDLSVAQRINPVGQEGGGGHFFASSTHAPVVGHAMGN